ncbi:MAG: hypothetical protein MI919_06610 [Holophagales bacterium]|nr:hypothetical protein [Holophagales bacterium]
MAVLAALAGLLAALGFSETGRAAPTPPEPGNPAPDTLAAAPIHAPDSTRAAMPAAGIVPSTAPTELPLGTSSEEEQFARYRQSVAVLDDGTFATVWTEGTGSQVGVRMQWIDSEGQPLLEAGGSVLGVEGTRQEAPAVVARAGGGAFVGFTRDPIHDGTFTTFVQAFDGQGRASWPTGGVQAMEDDDFHFQPHLVADSAGGVYVCAIKVFVDQIWCQHLDAAGHRTWADPGISAGGMAGRRMLPRGVLGAEEDLLLFWGNAGDPSDGVQDFLAMEGQRFSLGGTRLWGSTGLVLRRTRVPETTSFGEDFFAVVTDGSGGAVVIFEDTLGPFLTGPDVVAQRVAPDGSRLWEGKEDGFAVLSADAPLSRHDASIAGPDGSVFVSVLELGDGTPGNLVLYHLDGAGDTIWPAAGIPLSDPAAEGIHYSSSASFDGGILRWAFTRRPTPDPETSDIYLARFREDGGRLDGPGGFAVSTAIGRQELRGLAFSPAAAGLLVVWLDRRGGEGADYDTYGALVPAEVVFADGFELGDFAAWAATAPT